MTGILFRTSSYVDLCELEQIVEHTANNKKLEDIDMDTVVATFEGHTIFSLFFDQIQVYENILDQLMSMEFEPDEIWDVEVENSYLRRLYQILAQPTKDLKPKKATIFAQ